MRGLSLLFLLVVVGAIVILGAQNDESVALTFIGWSVRTYLWVIAAGSYLLGMLSGWAFAGALKRSWRRVVEPARS